MKTLKTFEDFAIFFEKAKDNYEAFYNDKATKYRVFFTEESNNMIVVTFSNENETEVTNYLLKSEDYTKEKNELCRLLFFENFFRDFDFKLWHYYPIEEFYDHFKGVNTEFGFYFDIDLGLTESENYLLSHRLFSRVNEFKKFRELNPTKKNELILIEWLEKEKEFFSNVKDDNNIFINFEKRNHIINAIEKLKKIIIEKEKHKMNEVVKFVESRDKAIISYWENGELDALLKHIKKYNSDIYFDFVEEKQIVKLVTVCYITLDITSPEVAKYHKQAQELLKKIRKGENNLS